MASIHKQLIENTVIKIADKVELCSSKDKWEKHPEEHLINELVACILGSRTKFEVAAVCLEKLKESSLLNRNGLLIKPKQTQIKIKRVLKENKYVYSQTKARYIVDTFLNIYYNEETTIKKILSDCSSDFDARDVLVRLCKGIGPKQASLFLRNIHYSEDLAILDSHVTRFMRIQGIENNIKQTITKANYIRYETSLRSYADNIKKSMAQLDVAIWIVMRVAQRDMKWL